MIVRACVYMRECATAGEVAERIPKPKPKVTEQNKPDPSIDGTGTVLDVD